MKNTNFIHWSGIAAIIAGFSTLSVTLLENNRPAYMGVIYFVSFISLLIALLGIYYYQREEAGLLTLLGTVTIIVANLLFGSEATIQLANILYGLGIILVAVATLRAAKLPSWVPILWLLAIVVGIPGIFFTDLQNSLFFFGALFFALGFSGAGVHLWKKVSETV